MEEDIKLLKEWLIQLNELFEKTKINNTKERKSLENLIKGYKKLEVENEELKRLANNKQFFSHIYIAQKYTPKSKIKEKIEELETKLKVFEKDIRYCKDKVEARLMNDEIYVLRRCMDLLQELMEDK